MTDNAPEQALMIAVTGLSCRFPGADSPEAFWDALVAGRELISTLSREELAKAGVDAARLDDPRYVPARGVLKDVELFDPDFFGMTVRDAELTDPQHRLLLECAHEALDRAGQGSRPARSRIGVFAGCGMNTYMLHHLEFLKALKDTVGDFPIALGNDKDFVATRIAYRLDLTGPAISVGSACSTGLVAVHQACQALLSWQCDMALAGAATVQLPQEAGYRHQDGGITSPDGHCRPFDAAAAGTVAGNGAAMLLLRRLDEALAAGDPIIGVIRASAVNNDGAAKIGFTAPGADGQAAVIGEALALADIDPATVGLVEAHGTGTPLGDPVEVAALVRAYGPASVPAALGSVKSMLGHLDTASGLAGIIKVLLALQHRTIPPSLHFHTANPHIDFAGRFRVPTTAEPWPAVSGTPRRAAVSAFGIGGTNVHVILEEAPAVVPASRPDDAGWRILPVSARSPGGLTATANRLAAHLTERPELVIADVAATLQDGRAALPCRRAVVARSPAEAAQTLDQPAEPTLAGTPSIAFLFPGQGAQYPGMARALAAAEPVFHAELERCLRLLKPRLDLRTLLDTADAATLAATGTAQPALFVVEYAMARLWQRWGVTPSALAGHSLGEYVAACLAGVFSLEDALTLVAARGALMQAQPPGSMLAVPFGEAEARTLLGPHIDLAAVNGPAQCVLSGPDATITAMEAALAARGVETRRLDTSHAFHSAMMEPVLEPFGVLLAGMTLKTPAIPVLSNLTGTWLTGEEARDPAYWQRHLRGTVRFGDNLATLLSAPSRLLLDVGPGGTLARMARRRSDFRPGQASLAAFAGPREDARKTLLDAAGRLWEAGGPLDWQRLREAAPGGRCISLPPTAFDRRRCWLDPRPVAETQAPVAAAAVPVDETPRFGLPSWIRRPVPPRYGSAPERWIIFADTTASQGDAVAARLRAAGLQAILVSPGGGFTRLADDRFLLDPADSTGYRTLLDNVGETFPTGILHLWSLDAPPALDAESVGLALSLGLRSVAALVKALGRRLVLPPTRLVIATRNTHDVTGVEAGHPAAAALDAAALVLPKEYLSLACVTVDLPDDSADALAPRLLGEMLSAACEPVVALRGPHRLVREILPADVPVSATPPVRSGATTLITGGLGGVGLEIAAWLGRQPGAKLTLLGRNGLPPRDRWDALLAAAALPGAGAAATSGIDVDVACFDNEVTEDIARIERNLAIRTIDDYPGLIADLNRYCSGLLLEWLESVNVRQADPTPVAVLRRRLGILPEFDHFFDYCLTILEEDRLALRDGDTIRFPEPPPAGLAALGERLKAEYPGFKALVELIGHCIGHYRVTLNGAVPTVSVLFPDGGEGLMIESARHTVEYINGRVYRLLLREMIGRILDRCPNRPLRILEVGGGNGVVTGILIPSLKGRDVTYHFTDIGRSFVVAAERKARDLGFDFMTFGSLDLSADPAAQGYADGSFDIVVALDVVHATPSIRTSMTHMERLLRPGGAVFLLESVRPFRWDNLIAGLAEGWWHVESGVRNGPPLLTIDQWDRALHDLNFESVVSYPRDEARRATTDAALIVAQKPLATDRSAAMPGVDDETARRIARVRAIEASGAEVLVLAGDVADPADLAAAVALTERRFGPVHGVIHAAMDMRSGALQIKDDDVLDAELRPKIDGALAIREVFANRPPLDFLVHCSSTTALTGGFGDFGYCAANAFLDALAPRLARDGFAPKTVVAINWDRWQGVGFARDYERWHQRMTGNALTGGMNPETALDGLARVLSSGPLFQVVIGAARAAPARPSATPAVDAAVRPHAVVVTGAHPRPALATPWRAPASGGEGLIARTWELVLNLSGIGADDDFSELGGDSLIAIQVASRLRDATGLDLPVRLLFEAPTPAVLARRIDALRWAAGAPAADTALEEEEGVV
jgi:acyl transferase domain-containing protein/SAM-dependent methyltransferase/acyl carrier protein